MTSKFDVGRKKELTMQPQKPSAVGSSEHSKSNTRTQQLSSSKSAVKFKTGDSGAKEEPRGVKKPG